MMSAIHIAFVVAAAFSASIAFFAAGYEFGHRRGFNECADGLKELLKGKQERTREANECIDAMARLIKDDNDKCEDKKPRS